MFFSTFCEIFRTSDIHNTLGVNSMFFLKKNSEQLVLIAHSVDCMVGIVKSYDTVVGSWKRA